MWWAKLPDPYWFGKRRTPNPLSLSIPEMGTVRGSKIPGRAAMLALFVFARLISRGRAAGASLCDRGAIAPGKLCRVRNPG
jgi:hypothetical protein